MARTSLAGVLCVCIILSVAAPADVHLPPSLLPGWLQWVFIALFGLGVVASGAMSLMERWRRATFLLGAAMLWLAVVRRTCDSNRVGVFAVRSRLLDLIFSDDLLAAFVEIFVLVDCF